LNLFYHSPLHADVIELDAEESRHVKAMRHHDGDTILLTDGQGTRVTGELIWKKHVAGVQVIQREHMSDSGERLRLVMAPTKQHERMEWLVEKAVELGIASIHFVQCSNSERPIVRMDRLHRVAIAAIKQSQRLHLPGLHDVVKMEQLIAQLSGGVHLLAHCRDDFPRQPIAVHNQSNDVTIWIGPEGDFTLREIEIATEKGMIGISLGEARLRTETAALAALAAIQMQQ
jgi:16S rRNA (uracil1498-N3)-methyltransferase